MSGKNTKKVRRGKKHHEEEPIAEQLEWNENPIAEQQVNEEPQEEPVEEPQEETVEEPVEEPQEETVEEPQEQTVEEPQEEPIEEPQEEPQEETVEETPEEPTEESTEENVEETIANEVEEQESLESVVVEEDVHINIDSEETIENIPGTPEETTANEAEDHSTIFIINENIEEISANSDIEDIPDETDIQLTEEYPENIDNVNTHSTQTSEQPSKVVSPIVSKQSSNVASPIVSKQATPVVSKQPTPVVSKQPTPVVSKQATPIVSKQATPVVSKQPTPVVSKQPTPIVSNQPSQVSTPIVSKKPTPIVSKQSTPIVSKQPTPVVSKQATPVVSKQASRVPTPIVSKQPSRVPSPVISKQATPVVSNQSSLVSSPVVSKQSTPRISPVIQAELMLARNSTSKISRENGIETTSISKTSIKEDIMSELELPAIANHPSEHIELEIKSTIEDNKKVTFDKMADYFSKNLGISKTIEEESPEDIAREAAEHQTKIEYDPNTMGMIRKRRVDRQLLANDLSSELPISLRYNENIHIDNEAEIENYKDEWCLWVEDGLDKLDELIMLLDELEIKYKNSSRRNRYTANSIQFLNLLLGSGIVYVQSSTTNAELIRDWNTVAGGLSTLSTMIYNYFGFAKKSTHYAVVASNINILNCWVKSKLILPLDKRFSPYDIYIIATKALQTILEEANQKKNDSK